MFFSLILDLWIILSSFLTPFSFQIRLNISRFSKRSHTFTLHSIFPVHSVFCAPFLFPSISGLGSWQIIWLLSDSDSCSSNKILEIKSTDVNGNPSELLQTHILFTQTQSTACRHWYNKPYKSETFLLMLVQKKYSKKNERWLFSSPKLSTLLSVSANVTLWTLDKTKSLVIQTRLTVWRSRAEVLGKWPSTLRC